MAKPQVGVVGYGVIGQRLADGVALQEDMELVGVVDVAPTLSTRALCESGMPYDLYVVEAGQKAAFDACGIPVTGTMDDLLGKVDIVLDSSPGGVGRKNKELYQARGVKAIFQGGEKNDIVDVFFHGYSSAPSTPSTARLAWSASSSPSCAASPTPATRIAASPTSPRWSLCRITRPSTS